MCEFSRKRGVSAFCALCETGLTLHKSAKGFLIVVSLATGKSADCGSPCVFQAVQMAATQGTRDPTTTTKNTDHGNALFPLAARHAEASRTLNFWRHSFLFESFQGGATKGVVCVIVIVHGAHCTACHGSYFTARRTVQIVRPTSALVTETLLTTTMLRFHFTLSECD